MAKSKYVLTEKQIIKRINEGRGAGRLSDYKSWLYVNEVPSEGRSQRVYSHLTGRIHHVLSDLEFAVFLLLDHNPAVTDIREQFPLNRDDTLNISKEGQLWHPSQGGVNLVMSSDFLVNTASKTQPKFAIQAKYSKDLKDPRTSKATTPKRSHRPYSSIDTSKKAGDTVSTNEPGSNGEVPSADMGGGMQDCTDKSEEYASRFTAFNMMVQMLEEKYACTIIDSYTNELDQVGRSKCHLIDSGAKRTIRCVVVERNGHVNYLLEVDVTGLSKWISTKCIRQIDTRNWKEQFSRIKKGVVTKSLGWPTQEMDAMFGFKKHIGISHPKSIDGHPTGIATESILDWAGRVANKL